jgi:hypothetical protein
VITQDTDGGEVGCGATVGDGTEVVELDVAIGGADVAIIAGDISVVVSILSGLSMSTKLVLTHPGVLSGSSI